MDAYIAKSCPSNVQPGQCGGYYNGLGLVCQLFFIKFVYEFVRHVVGIGDIAHVYSRINE
jgi:hypothetical protein